MKKIATLVFALGWAAATLYSYQQSDPAEPTSINVTHLRPGAGEPGR